MDKTNNREFTMMDYRKSYENESRILALEEAPVYKRVEASAFKTELKFWMPIISIIASGAAAFVMLRSSHNALATEVEELNILTQSIYTINTNISLIQKDIEYIKGEST